MMLDIPFLVILAQGTTLTELCEPCILVPERRGTGEGAGFEILSGRLTSILGLQLAGREQLSGILCVRFVLTALNTQIK